MNTINIASLTWNMWQQEKELSFKRFETLLSKETIEPTMTEEMMTTWLAKLLKETSHANLSSTIKEYRQALNVLANSNPNLNKLFRPLVIFLSKNAEYLQTINSLEINLHLLYIFSITNVNHQINNQQFFQENFIPTDYFENTKELEQTSVFLPTTKSPNQEEQRKLKIFSYHNEVEKKIKSYLKTVSKEEQDIIIETILKNVPTPLNITYLNHLLYYQNTVKKETIIKRQRIKNELKKGKIYYDIY